MLLATAMLAGLGATIDTSAAPAAEQWYQTDLHRHSVLSADAKVDLGVVAQNMRSLGYNAVFVTDHDRGSEFQISGATANSLTLTDGIGSWQAPRTTGTGSATNEFVTSPVRSGTQSLHLAASSPTTGETTLWKSRGPSLRSGDAIMDFWVNPASIGSGSGVYASASIGGDVTIASPSGYTNTAGVTTLDKSTVLVWQIGGARTASSVPNRRVITQDLPYTLNSWNHYTINVSTGATSWNGAPLAGANGGLQEIPGADPADPQNALTYVKLAARSNGTPVDAYVDDFSLTASAPLCPASEFAQRNAQISSYATPDFALFGAREMGQTKHTQQLNFGIADARDYEFPGETALCGATNTASAPFRFHRYGSDNIPDVHASGYPAINNHPGTTDDVPDVIATQGHGADGIEAYNAFDFTSVWDSILGQDHPITGSAGTDSHEILGTKAVATYLRSPALTLDDLMRNYYEGRLYVAFTSFAGRVVLNLDGSAEPSAGRYPVYVPASQTSASVSLDVSAGLLAGDTIRWVTNSGSGPAASTVTRSGSSYSETRTVPLSGSFTYVRAEVRDAGGSLKALTQPIFFRRVSGLPSQTSYRVDRITTANGRGYTNVSTRGITASSYDTAKQRLSLTLGNPAGTRTSLIASASATPQFVTVNGSVVAPALSLFAHQTTSGSSWFYDAPSQRLYLQVEQSAASAGVAISFSPGGRETATPPSIPADVVATAVSASQIDLRWSASSDDVDGYRVYRDDDAAPLATLGATATSFSDTGLTASTTHSYTVDAFDAHGASSGKSAAASAATQAPPATTTLGAVADAYVSDAAPTTSFGGATTLRTDASAPLQVSYLRFDVAGLRRAPQKAILRVYANSAHAVGYAVFGVASTTWVESGAGSITFSNAPPLAAVATGSSKAATAGSYTSVDVTSLIAGNGPVSMALKSTSATGLAMGSREAASAAQRPELVVTRAPDDVQSPSVPTTLAAVAASASRIDLSWSASSDDVGVTEYEIRRGGALVATVGGTTTSISDDVPFPATSYSYTVSARDAAGNVSDPSDPVAATSGPFVDVAAPTVPPALSATAVSPSRIDLSWSPSTDDVAVTGYRVRRDTFLIATVAETSFSDTGLTDGTSHSYTVQAFDTAGNDSPESTLASASTPEGQPPTVPGDLSATAVSESRIDVTWSASSDNVAVSGYEIRRDGVVVATVGGGTTSISDSVPLASTTYSYTVFARDAAGNVSAASDAVVATSGPAGDREAPTVPGGVAATPDGASRIDLRWDASSDDVGVREYRIRRDGSVLAEVDGATTTFSDTGLTPSTTYAYTVDARDGADNISSQSAAATATTAAPLPAKMAFGPVADAYLDDSKTTTNFGTSATLRADGAAPVQLSYLRFDVRGLGGAPSRAMLRVYANSAQSTGYSVFGVPDTTWIESGSGSITYANAPPAAATATGSSGATIAGSYTTVDVTPLIAGNGLVSMALKTANTTALSLASREGAAGKRPELVVTP